MREPPDLRLYVSTRVPPGGVTFLSFRSLTIGPIIMAEYADCTHCPRGTAHTHFEPKRLSTAQMLNAFVAELSVGEDAQFFHEDAVELAKIALRERLQGGMELAVRID